LKFFAIGFEGRSCFEIALEKEKKATNVRGFLPFPMFCDMDLV
jgi:hypothetical protein